MMWVSSGWGSEPGQPLVSDSEDEEPLQCPNAGGTASPQVVAESDPEELDVSPDVHVLRKRLPPPSTSGRNDLDVGGPKKRRLDPETPPNPSSQPLNHSVSHEGVVGPDAERWRGSHPTVDVGSDSDDKEHPKSAVFHLNRHQPALVRNADPNVTPRTPNPDLGGPRNGRWALTVNSDADVEEVEFLQSIRQPKILQKTPNVPQSIGVGVEIPQSDPGSPRNGFRVVVEGGDTDVEVAESSDLVAGRAQSSGQRMLTVGSDADAEDTGRPQRLRMTPNALKVKMETPNPPPGGPREELEVLTMGGDTEVEEYGVDSVLCSTTHRVTRKAPNLFNIKADGSQKGRRPEPEVGADPDGGDPLRGDPDPDVGRSKIRLKLALVDSDTDVEEDVAYPRIPAGTPKPLIGAAVVMETPNPDPKGPQVADQSLEVGSDTDVEEEELNPDVPHPKHPKTPHITPKDPDVLMETQNPDPKESQVGDQSLEVGSDTDVEEGELNPVVPHPKNPQTPRIAPKNPDVVVETPNPDLKGSEVGDQSLEVGSDTDVEEQELNPDVPHPKNPKTPRIAPKDPDVLMETPNPDAAGLNGDPDEDLRGVESPRAPTVMRGVTDSAALGASAPDVAPAVLAAPHPDVPPPLSPQGGCDPHGEDAAPAAHIGRFWTRIRPQNPNVGCDAMGGGTDVRQTDPKRGESTPKWQSLAPEPCGDGGVGGTVPKRHDPAPNTDVESPKPNDGTQRHRGETSKMGSDTVKVPVPKSPDLAPNLGRPNGDADVTESDAEAEDDPDLFLAPTQNFLLPTQNFLPPTQNFLPPTQSFLPPPTQGGCPPDTTPAWDPEEPTQCFYHPEEEEEKEEEEEEPPQSHVATRVAAVTPAQEDVGTNGAPSKDVAEGPHHNQRQARARGGGASGKRGGAKALGGGAMTEPAPLRRSPRLLARLLPAEPKMGRGQDEPRPLPAARPRRGGHAPLQKKAREEEPADITQPQLRPRGSSASSSPKVLFTGVVASPGMEAALGVLGGSMAASVFDCTHLVTDRVRRTVKFLCAVARGIAIVTPNWLHESSRSGRVLPPGPFLVRDSQQEQHFGFNLSQALSRARRRPLLQGYEVHVTPSVRPEPEHMRDIITCSGGTFLPAMPCTYGPRRLVISCPEDSESWRPALEAQLPLLSAELLLTGLLRQQLQLQLFFLTPLGPPQDPPLSPRRLRVRRDPSGTRRRGQLRVK